MVDRGFSVVIPFRNEERSLPHLLSCLEKSRASDIKVELLFIDDRSADRGKELIEQWQSSIPHRVIESKGEGKKAAIRTGTVCAAHDTILTLDADVHLPQGFLNQISRKVIRGGEPLAILPVIPLPVKTLVGRFATMEFMTLLGATFSSAALKKPIMASGAALLFNRNELALQENGVASGDDMFLLHQAKEKLLEVGYTLDPNQGVEVKMPEELSDFWSQRSRWTAKSSEYTDHDTLVVAWVVFAFNLCIASIVLMVLVGVLKPAMAIVFFGFKFVIDFFFLWKVYSYFKRTSELWTYPIFALVYPFYVPILALSSRLNTFQWKDRTIKK